ncbi:hypothetical protein Q8W40_27780 [Vibrio penaeicida]|uniref:hypothetical protein n=1 Tax=Vibrio penaeicida TaxID=104609 RepID=UPI002734741F|nr:hypothetical protein [Vibrio penaeicida]MDP2576007.1 hypothetical protein [Vibrio penaeicida]
MEFVFENSVVKVNSEDIGSAGDDADITISEEIGFDRRTTVEITEGNSVTRIALLWSHFSSTAEASLHWNEGSHVLFLGAGSVSAVIDILNKCILDINYPELFWGWKHLKGNILELGELDCRLYTSSGQIIGQAPVDPPYDYKITDKGVFFSSIVAGKTSIKLKQC